MNWAAPLNLDLLQRIMLINSTAENLIGFVRSWERPLSSQRIFKRLGTAQPAASLQSFQTQAQTAMHLGLVEA